ncbi:MAG: glutamine--fructose-6-phosphate transaminase (isomerizing) [Candidatus Micrarchaeota archaeon]|nr:glutamine--fructose-6-phosphate transaminase (isomerizing) [Candidatus Micrarchaeota archaeon]
MCGIIGYVGFRNASQVLYEGLKALEYRGYDSAGIATQRQKKIKVIKDSGRIEQIHSKYNFLQLSGQVGIGHTRWATHGGVTKQNAHPHCDCKKEVFIVHNGVIENFDELKMNLIAGGHSFTSETDTEVIAHLFEEELKSTKNAADAFASAISKLSGSWAIAAMKKGQQTLYLARNGSPLIIGVGRGEMFCASDVPALLPYTKKVIYLENGDRAILTSGKCLIYNKEGMPAERAVHYVEWTAQMAEKGGYPHFMLKEISEQEEKVKEALAADVSAAVQLLKNQKSFCVVACGSSYYAGLVFKTALQAGTGTVVDVIIGSEFANLWSGKDKVVVAISQSGETADTLAAVRFAKGKGAKIIAITNVAGSSLYREADANVLIGAGPEIAVVATKSFICQLAVLLKIALLLSGKKAQLAKLHGLPSKIAQLMKSSEEIEKIASILCKRKDFFFIGRGMAFPAALEGALKLKEITYLHAEAYPAGELKHGPLSLLDENVVVVALAPSSQNLPKMLSNIQECKARNAQIVIVSDSKEAFEKSKLCIKLPPCETEEIPIVYVIPLQLLAYYMATKLGRDPDKPRNLAKSVTVE